MRLKKRWQLGEITNFKTRRWHIGTARPTTAVDPRDLKPCCLRALDVVYVTVARAATGTSRGLFQIERFEPLG